MRMLKLGETYRQAWVARSPRPSSVRSINRLVEFLNHMRVSSAAKRQWLIREFPELSNRLHGD
jgi:hypothetical protein